VEYALKPQSMSKQFKAATTAGARHAVIVPPSAATSGDHAYVVRDLAAGEQQTYADAAAVVTALTTGATAR
jgi:histidyl-tRNA synthetase